MEEFKIQRAVRSQARARIALVAASGGGKSYSALRLAKGLVEYMLGADLCRGTLEGKIGMIDTERKSGSLYGHLLPFDVINLEAPYTTARYVGALQALEDAGCVVIIIDQISHAWAGAGGLLEVVDRLKASSRNDFAPWKEVTPEQNDFIERILASPAHIIANMRAKSVYVMEEYTGKDGSKKNKPKRMGMAPIQRAGIEFEFTTVLDLEVGTNLATSTKDRTGLFHDQSVRLNEEWGVKLGHWLYEGQAADEGRDHRSASDRAEAIAGAGCRACERALTIPDLARVFESHQGLLRALREEVDGDVLVGLMRSLVLAKDVRKAKLSLPEAAVVPSDALDIEDAAALEEWCRQADDCRVAFLEHFQVPRFGHLSGAKLQAAAEWIQKRVLLAQNPDPILPPVRFSGRIVVETRKGVFDDLPNDLPF